ncbi:MAG: hypothetical protein M3R48_06735, partial [Candidatus Dormibacteraeota bacterium]|nr:hypothetical protein [Candidatus Dormibacteraeota bacterium]
TRRPVPALGPVRGCAVLPHFDGFGRRWIPSARSALGPEVTLIGVDERGAAFWDGESWTARGPGHVTVVRDDETTEFASGVAIPGLAPPSTS